MSRQRGCSEEGGGGGKTFSEWLYVKGLGTDMVLLRLEIDPSGNGYRYFEKVKVAWREGSRSRKTYWYKPSSEKRHPSARQIGGSEIDRFWHELPEILRYFLPPRQHTVEQRALQIPWGCIREERPPVALDRSAWYFQDYQWRKVTITLLGK